MQPRSRPRQARRRATPRSARLAVLTALMTLAPASASLASPAMGCPESEPMLCLPAWRWSRSAGMFHTDFGIRDVGEVASSGIARVLFGIADSVWSLTLWLVKNATSLNLFSVDGIAKMLNDGYVASFNAVQPFLVPFMGLLAVMIVVVRNARGATGGSGGKGGFGQLAVPMACLGALTAMAVFTGATTPVAEPDDDLSNSRVTGVYVDAVGNDVSVPGGSPAWIAGHLYLLTDYGANKMTSAGTYFNAKPSPVNAGNKLDCAEYVHVLRTTYLKGQGWNQDDLDDGKTLEVDAANDPGFGEVTAGVAALTSYMWERTYLASWRTAQFGDTPGGQRAYCYLLEEKQPNISNGHVREVWRTVGLPVKDDEGRGILNRDAPELYRAEMATLALCTYDADQPAGPGPLAEFHRPGSDASDGRWRVAPDMQNVAVGAAERTSYWDAARAAADNGVSGGIGAAVDRTFNQMPRHAAAWGEYCEKWWTDKGTGDRGTVDVNLPGGGVASDPFAWLARKIVEGGAEAIGRGVNNGREDAAEDDEGLVQADAPLVFNTSADVRNVTQTTGMDDLGQEGQALSREYFSALSGHSLGSGLGAGFVAILVSFLYLLALGGMAAGSIVAQFGVAAFIIVLPFILLIGMWPSDGTKQKVVKAVRMGAMMTAARFVFVTILGIIATLTSTFIHIIDAWQGTATITPAAPVAGSPLLASLIYPGTNFSGSGASTQFLMALPPILTYLIFKKLAKELGFGNPMSLSGGMKMVGNAANYAMDPSTHRPGRAMSMMRTYMNPLSMYGPMSARMLLKKARRGLGNESGPSGPPRRRDRPPDTRTGMSGSAGDSGQGASSRSGADGKAADGTGAGRTGGARGRRAGAAPGGGASSGAGKKVSPGGAGGVEPSPDDETGPELDPSNPFIDPRIAGTRHPSANPLVNAAGERVDSRRDRMSDRAARAGQTRAGQLVGAARHVSEAMRARGGLVGFGYRSGSKVLKGAAAATLIGATGGAGLPVLAGFAGYQALKGVGAQVGQASMLHRVGLKTGPNHPTDEPDSADGGPPPTGSGSGTGSGGGGGTPLDAHERAASNGSGSGTRNAPPKPPPPTDEYAAERQPRPPRAPVPDEPAGRAPMSGSAPVPPSGAAAAEAARVAAAEGARAGRESAQHSAQQATRAAQQARDSAAHAEDSVARGYSVGESHLDMQAQQNASHLRNVRDSHDAQTRRVRSHLNDAARRNAPS